MRTTHGLKCLQMMTMAVVAMSVCVVGGADAQAIKMLRVEDADALAKPDAVFWASAPATTVVMLPQTITVPTHPTAAVTELSVRAAHDGRRFAFLIAWKDATRSDRIVVDQFGDQVAVELPMNYQDKVIPSPMMGNPGARVSILQWRAAFQHDLEHGDPQVRDLYPNALVDVYPDQVLAATDARPYTGALGLDNPVSHAIKTPVLDQIAEGFGTMTVKAEQHADGKGVWEAGTWRVVISHPMKRGDNDPDLAPGGKTLAAFAVWDGGSKEVGSRKAWATWVPVEVAE